MKDEDVEAKELKRFEFSAKSFNPYDPHCICKNYYEKVYYPWIHGACHWPEEDPWRYCYKSFRLNELVNMVVEWKETLQATSPQEETTTTTTVSNKSTQDKGKRNISESKEAVQR